MVTANSSQRDDNTILKFKKISSNAFTPKRATINSAGFDLFSAETKEINAHDRGIIHTDITVILPEGTYGRVAPRSGLASKYFIHVGAGVIDFDYRGNICIVIFNHLDKPFQINIGDRIAQFIIEKICTPKLIEVQDLDETDRGMSGFGSTGK